MSNIILQGLSCSVSMSSQGQAEAEHAVDRHFIWPSTEILTLST